VARLRELVETDVLTLDEAREEVGQEPLPNGAGAVTLSVYRERAKLQGQIGGIGQNSNGNGRALPLPPQPLPLPLGGDQ
jgi:hypothetical protein